MIVVVLGQESLLARRFLSELKKKVEATHQIQSVACKDQDFEVLTRQITAPTLFQDKVLFLFYNPFSAPEFARRAWQARKMFLERSEHTFVFFEEEGTRQSKLKAFLSKHGKVHEFPRLSGKGLLSFAEREFARCGVKAERRALEEVVARAGRDVWQLASEIAKLSAYKEKGVVSKEDVELLVPESFEPEIFATLSAIARQRQREALHLLSLHFIAREAPLYLLSMFLYQLRLLVAAKDLQERGASSLALQTSLGAHPIAARKAAQEARTFSLSSLKALYAKAFDLDLALKTSKGAPEQLLYLFVGQAAAKEKQQG